MTDTFELDSRHIWHPFTQAATASPPIPILRAEGATLVAEDGRRFLDLISSWWVNLHGHAHPAIARAIAEQAIALEQVIFADFTHAPAARLAKRVTDILPAGLTKVFYSDNGSTAVEAALKIALQYWTNRGEQRRHFIGFQGGYHGDTVGAMSAGQASGFFRAWEDLLFPVNMVPYPDTWHGDTTAAAREAIALLELDRLLNDPSRPVAAIILEPLVQGASGMRMSRPEFLSAIAERAKETGTLLILDEVMTGFGRTGDLFACQTAGITPDLICLSKGLSGGFLPLAMTVATEKIFDAFLDQDPGKAFLHGHSFTANPLGCAAALASLDLLLAHECGTARDAIKQVHAQRLPALCAAGLGMKSRWRGTIGALQMTNPPRSSASLKDRFLDTGLLLRPLGDVLYLLPPYCVSETVLHDAYDRIESVLRSA